MAFYVTVVIFLMTLLMEKFTSIVFGTIDIWLKSMLVIETKFGTFCILAML